MRRGEGGGERWNNGEEGDGRRKGDDSELAEGEYIGVVNAGSDFDIVGADSWPCADFSSSARILRNCNGSASILLKLLSEIERLRRWYRGRN